MLANGFNNDGYTPCLHSEQRHNQRSCRDALSVTSPQEPDRLCSSKWMDSQSGYEMHRTLTTDGLESMLLGDQSPSLAFSPSFSHFDNICSKPLPMEYEMKDEGDRMPAESIYGLKPEGQNGSRCESDRSSFSVEPEMLCQPQKKKRSTSPIRLLNRMHSDTAMMYRARQGSYSSPVYFVQDTGNSYRASEVFVEAPRDHGHCARCSGGVGEYTHPPPMSLERVLGNTPPIQYPAPSAQHQGWPVTEAPLRVMPEYWQEHLRHPETQTGRRDGRTWHCYRSESCPAHLQPSEEPRSFNAQLSRQLCVYPGRPVENAEADREMSVPSTKRRVHRKRENLPKESTAVLKKWLLSHLMMPYPMNEEKVALCCATGLEISQINNWFINARVRIWKPLVMKVFRTFQDQLKSHADESGDENLAKRISDADKSTTMGMITLLTSLPEARKALDRAATDSVSSLLTR